jgi:ribosomal protein S6
MKDDVMEQDIETIGLIDEEGDNARQGVYELGYHIVPTVTEDELSSEVSKVTDFLKAEKVDFIGERFPGKIQLAYPIAKRINGKRNNFNDAYFGWLAFEASTEIAAKLKAVMDAHPQVLRYLIVRTDRDAIAAAMSGAIADVTPTGDIGKPKREADLGAGGEMSEVALDEALQTMATEDAKVAE